MDPRRLPSAVPGHEGLRVGIAGGELTATRRATAAFTIPLSRWSAVADRGWYSGDIHIHHIAPKTCRLEMDAEDLNVANILTSDFTLDQREFEGKLNAYSERQASDLRQPGISQRSLRAHVRAEPEATDQAGGTIRRPMLPTARAGLRPCPRSGRLCLVGAFPSMPALESPLDVAMEKLDGLEILCVLEPRELPVFVRKQVPEMGANSGLRMWYRYLNCGFPLAATAGTDKMTTFVTVGANRVYAHVDGEFNYQNWVDALKRGRTFVSNNPLADVHGERSGAWRAIGAGCREGPGAPDFRAGGIATALRQTGNRAQRRRDRIGVTERPAPCGGDPAGVSGDAEVAGSRRAPWRTWARYPAVKFSEIHRGEGTLFSSLYGTRRPENVFAHTSPVYAIVDGKPIRSWDDAQYYIGYLQHAIDWLRPEARFASAEDKKSSIAAFEQAQSCVRAAGSRRQVKPDAVRAIQTTRYSDRPQWPRIVSRSPCRSSATT